MAFFKCKQTGNIFEFEFEHDINSMKNHQDYEEVQSQVAVEETVKETTKKVK